MTSMSAVRSERMNVRANLGSPVAEVIERHDIPTTRLVQIREEGADDRAPEMANMERLCDVGGRVFDDNLLPFA